MVLLEEAEGVWKERLEKSIARREGKGYKLNTEVRSAMAAFDPEHTVYVSDENGLSRQRIRNIRLIEDNDGNKNVCIMVDRY